LLRRRSVAGVYAVVVGGIMHIDLDLTEVEVLFG
jgi:hypothetical protein